MNTKTSENDSDTHPCITQFAISTALPYDKKDKNPKERSRNICLAKIDTLSTLPHTVVISTISVVVKYFFKYDYCVGLISRRLFQCQIYKEVRKIGISEQIDQSYINLPPSGGQVTPGAYFAPYTPYYVMNGYPQPYVAQQVAMSPPVNGFQPASANAAPKQVAKENPCMLWEQCYYIIREK